MSVYDCVLFAASASHLPFIIVAGLFLLTAAVVIIVNIQPDKRRRNTQRDCVIPKAGKGKGPVPSGRAGDYSQAEGTGRRF